MGSHTRRVVPMAARNARSLEAVLTVKATLDYRTAETDFPGTALRGFGERVVATRLPALADVAPYNKARGLSLDDRSRLVDLAAFYRETGQRPRIEVWAGDDQPELRNLLLGEGLAPAMATVMLQARPCEVPATAPAGVQVHEVEVADPRYLDIMTSDYGVQLGATDLRRMIAIEHSTPGLRRYLATVDGRPAAAAAMFTVTGASVLVGAATLTAHRRRGAQSALIHRRLYDASDDSTVVVVTAALRSTSRTNLERLGFTVSHVRTLWQ